MTRGQKKKTSLASASTTSTMSSDNLVETLVAALQNLRPSESIQSVTMEKFNEAEESIGDYFIRLENNFLLRGLVEPTGQGADANKIAEVKTQKVRLLMNYLSPKYCKVLHDLCSPDVPNTKSYEDLKKLLIDYLDKPANEIVEQNRFLLRVQKDGESIAKFVAELKNLTNHCNFICANCKKSTAGAHLRSQFIRGVREADVREKLLLQSSGLTFEKAVDIAKAAVEAKDESKQIQNSTFHATTVPSTSAAPPVEHKINKFGFKNFRNQGQGRRFKQPVKQFQNLQNCCFRCGNKEHRANKCPHINDTCSCCQKKGHLQSVCRSKLQNQFQKGKRPFYKKTLPQQNARSSNADTKKDEQINYFDMGVLSSSSTDKFYVPVTIEGTKKNFELDSGAAVSTLSISEATSIFPSSKIQATNAVFKTFNKQVIYPIGVAKVYVTCRDMSRKVDLYIVPDNCSVVLGREWIRAFKLLPEFELQGLESITVSKENRDVLIEKLLSEFEDLFQPGNW